METTFMTIHNLTPDANILFASESIVEILGYEPSQVIGRSCFDYFHPDEVPFARNVHSRGVLLDKAAVLNYARIRNSDGLWVGCECVFTVVYEVLVACTSIYRGDAKNERRAAEAPAIRRLFASSPRDPRYHMLEHLSSKFRTPPQASLLEPRAALILNRFTRTLTVMYATNAVSSILGVSPEQFKDKSFYECIQENCLTEAIRCLESAKANDSIAYLRFWYRDPRRQEDFDEELREASQSSDSEDGGVQLYGEMDVDSEPAAESSTSHSGRDTSGDDTAMMRQTSPSRAKKTSRTYSSESTNIERDSSGASQPSRSSTSSLAIVTPSERRRRRQGQATPRNDDPYEIEAVISCTSDGLVVVLRRARPMIPSLQPPIPMPHFPNGLFAAPWGANPIRPHQYQPDARNSFLHGLQAPPIPPGGPPMDEFMNSIREVAVFAWSLTGINGNIASYGHGTPRGEAVPPAGLPIWDPFGQPSPGYRGPENQALERWNRMGRMTNEPYDGNKMPYHHVHPEVNLRHQNGYDPGLMGSDNPASTDFAPNADHLAQIHEAQLYGQRDPVQVQSIWLPGSPNDHPAPSPTEWTRGSRYLW
ncbi:hypothetical protein N431DRAFT_356357 [Stipitochalara longipes BDJ]|nr:hypothetical protein N431DRAFT_356357 [Stipitochalara longipes BDJ]